LTHSVKTKTNSDKRKTFDKNLLELLDIINIQALVIYTQYNLTNYTTSAPDVNDIYNAALEAQLIKAHIGAKDNQRFRQS